MSLPTPPIIAAAFAASAANQASGGATPGAKTNPIPVASQIGVTPGAASLPDGFPPLTMTPVVAGGTPPYGQDLNGILYLISANVAAIMAGQLNSYSSTQATAIGGYAFGAILLMASGNGLWVSTNANNSSNPDTGGSGWAPLVSYGYANVGGLTNANVTLTAAQWSAPLIVFSGALTGNINIIFPTTTQLWTIVNSTTGAYTLTCKTASGTGEVIAQNGWTAPSGIGGDGTNINTTWLAPSYGTVPFTAGGISGSPTGTGYYSANGKSVMLYIPAISGTSNATTFSLTGLPPSLYPARVQNLAVPEASMTNNGTNVTVATGGGVSMQIQTNGTITFSLSPSGWTASGTKSITYVFSVSYLLN